MKSYKCRLYPEQEQEPKLELAKEICRQTHNYSLSLFSSVPEGYGEGEMKNYLLDLKTIDENFRKAAHSSSLQAEIEKIYDNLLGLSEKKKKGYKVGRLRYKGKNWKKTYVYKSGFKILKGNKKNNLLYLSKIGNIKMILHKKIEGKIKQVIIKKEIDKWFAIIQTDAVIQLKHGEKEIGIDFSPSKFGVCSDETINISMPKEINITEKKLKKLHRELSKKKKGSNNRKKAIKKLQIKYKKLTNQKENHYHQTSYKLVTNCKLIGIEDLNLKKLMMISSNARNYQKSGWATYINQYLKYKAESAGCEIWKCDRFEPTTQRCSCCGKINPNKLTVEDRIFNCPFCGLSLDRDINASRNIKKYCKAGTVFCGVDTSTNTIKCLQVSTRNLKYNSRRKQEKISNLIVGEAH